MAKNNTTFDNVFRTMLEKMPELIVPVLNEIFGTNYPLDVPLEQLRNEHQTLNGERITDSYFRIGKKGYHFECQSTGDSKMVIRMVEYDFAISIENVKKENGIFRMRFPHSAVIYLRGTRKKSLRMELIMPDGKIVRYQVPVLCVQKYTKDEIFQKKLLFLLPFYIMRYEKDKKKINKSETELHKLLEEYESILQHLDKILYDQETMYGRLLELMKEISDYIFKKEESVKKRIGDIVGGKVLELQTDKALQRGKELGEKIGREIGKEIGRKIGEIKGICETAQEFGVSKETLKKKLIEKFNFTEAEAQSHIDKYWKE